MTAQDILKEKIHKYYRNGFLSYYDYIGREKYSEPDTLYWCMKNHYACIIAESDGRVNETCYSKRNGRKRKIMRTKDAAWNSVYEEYMQKTLDELYQDSVKRRLKGQLFLQNGRPIPIKRD